MKPYQKKILIGMKKFHEDLLMNEHVSTDEGQEGMLGKLEEEYNVDHRSNVYVTGTLSLVINKPHHQNKIMNSSYYDNLSHPNRVNMPQITTVIEEHNLSGIDKADNDSHDNGSV